MRRLEKENANLREMLTEIYNAPGMPGYIRAQKSFELMKSD